MGAAGALIGGTFAYIAFGILTAMAGWFLLRTKRLTKDESQIFCVSTFVAWFCMWLMWICTWLHQWHPIIRPINPHINDEEPAAH